MATLSGWSRNWFANNDGHWHLTPGHWEVLTLEAAVDKLLAAETVRRGKFEHDLRQKLEPL